MKILLQNSLEQKNTNPTLRVTSSDVEATKRRKHSPTAIIAIACLKSEDSLVAPVQSGRDVLLDVPHAVVGEVAHQHLPSQVQDFIHHVPKSVEQIPLLLLQERSEAGCEGWGRLIGRKRRQNEKDGLVGIWWQKMCKEKKVIIKEK